MPSAPRNVTAVPYTPNAILVKWQAPENFNAETVGYSVLWYAKYKNGTDDVQENFPGKYDNNSIFLEKLSPAQNYTIKVSTFMTNFSNLRPYNTF